MAQRISAQLSLERLRPIIERELSEGIGLEAQINGITRVKFFPRLELELDDDDGSMAIEVGPAHEYLAVEIGILTVSTFRSRLVDSDIMSNSIRPRPTAVCLTMFLVAFSLTGSATSGENNKEEVWDQAAVTKLATELEQTLREAYEQSLKAPPQQTALQQRERDAAQGVIRRARDLGEDYARKMRAGWDRGASEPYFRAVVEEVEHVWTTAGNAVPAESAKPRIDRLQRILDALRARYDAR